MSSKAPLKGKWFFIQDTRSKLRRCWLIWLTAGPLFRRECTERVEFNWEWEFTMFKKLHRQDVYWYKRNVWVFWGLEEHTRVKRFLANRRLCPAFEQQRGDDDVLLWRHHAISLRVFCVRKSYGIAGRRSGLRHTITLKKNRALFSRWWCRDAD